METFVNDTVKFVIDANIDISGYALKIIKYRKPDGVTGYWDATVCPLDNNCLTYTCVSGDIDIPGEWIIQAYVSDLGVQLTGRWVRFMAHSILSDAGDRYLDFKGQTGLFTIGNTIYQTIEGVLVASAEITNIQDDGATGILVLTGIVGIFQDNKIIYESALGAEKLTDSDFTGDGSAWTLGDGQTYNAVADTIDYDGTQGANAQFNQNPGMQINIYYRIVRVITNYSAGQHRSFIDGIGLDFMTGDGTFVDIETHGAIGAVQHFGGDADFIGSFSSVSVKIITNAALVSGEIY